jgi:hypothetical protein
MRSTSLFLMTKNSDPVSGVNAVSFSRAVIALAHALLTNPNPVANVHAKIASKSIEE